MPLLSSSIMRLWEQRPGHTRVQFTDGSNACSCGYYMLRDNTRTSAGFACWDRGNAVTKKPGHAA